MLRVARLSECDGRASADRRSAMFEQVPASDVTHLSTVWRIRRDEARLRLMRNPAHPSASIWRMQSRVMGFLLGRYCGERPLGSTAYYAVDPSVLYRMRWHSGSLGRCDRCRCTHHRLGFYCHQCGQPRRVVRSPNELLCAVASVRHTSNIACAVAAAAMVLIGLIFASLMAPGF